MYSDLGSEYTEKQIKEIEKKVKKVYKEAQKDIEAKLKDFNERYKVKEAKYLEMLSKDGITQADFDDWKAGQVFQGKQWQAKLDQVTDTLYNSNKIAVDIVNGKRSDVFAFNANYQSYQMEYDAAIDFGFGVYDEATVINLIKNEPNLLPKRSVNKSKDTAWNRKLISSQITQGIIQGESLDKIAKRIARVTGNRNANTLLTAARTTMTGAQNAGRQISLNRATDMGINVMKEWMATLDNHTRDLHADLDGQKQPVSKPFEVDGYSIMYPGDPKADACMVYNCRCTMVGDVVDYPSIFSRRDNITGKVVNKLGPDTVENLTYRDWKMIKGLTETAKKIEELDKVTDVLREVCNMGHGTVEYEFNGHKLTDFKFKSFDSAFRKVVGDVKKEAQEKGVTLTKDEEFKWRTSFADKTSDGLRFTNISPFENYTEDYHTIVSELEKRGFKTIRVKNTLIKKNVPYRGVNTLVQTPSGYVIEMQYHTPESIDIKERINHPLYEQARKLDPTDPEKERLDKIMVENMNGIATPIGIETIKEVAYDTELTKNISPFGKYW